jgi:hypothetical protein
MEHMATVIIYLKNDVFLEPYQPKGVSRALSGGIFARNNEKQSKNLPL